MSYVPSKVVGVTTALYRRYRPENFAEVIGQEHVTTPLMAALRGNRVNHAYLFSGPRGCGKTTSARILARCLNCAEGPTDTPCGVCPSCRELSRDGGGSLDVVEIDAASHNGVDDARELRERAVFAPARDRYKIFILDEAHMVTAQGFNALLKIVEEPPPHVKFIFATTEPDKVIGTIRSRTHHYPFRLVPPTVLQDYLTEMCEREDVQVGGGVLPLVVRAGAGSVRDSLSVLDQLIAGAPPEGLSYENAVALLGYTNATLLDETVDAIAVRDGSSLFQLIERVVTTGLEPRRFVEDLLQRLRDLVVMAAGGQQADAVLTDIPADQLSRMRTQSEQTGLLQLSQWADVVNEALTEMTGATSPRLQLELLAARLLVSGQEVSTGAAVGVGVPAAARPAPTSSATTSPATSSATTSTATTSPRTAMSPPASTKPEKQPLAPIPPREPIQRQQSASQQPAAKVEAKPVDTPAPEVQEPQAQVPQDSPETPEVETPPVTAPVQADETTKVEQQTAPAPADAAIHLRERWNEVLDKLATISRSSWAVIAQNAKVGTLQDNQLTMVFNNPGVLRGFRSGAHPGNLEQAIYDVLELRVNVLASDNDAGQHVPGPVAQTAQTPAPPQFTQRVDKDQQINRGQQAEASWPEPVRHWDNATPDAVWTADPQQTRDTREASETQDPGKPHEQNQAGGQPNSSVATAPATPTPAPTATSTEESPPWDPVPAQPSEPGNANKPNAQTGPGQTSGMTLEEEAEILANTASQDAEPVGLPVVQEVFDAKVVREFNPEQIQPHS